MAKRPSARHKGLGDQKVDVGESLKALTKDVLGHIAETPEYSPVAKQVARDYLGRSDKPAYCERLEETMAKLFIIVRVLEHAEALPGSVLDTLIDTCHEIDRIRIAMEKDGV